MLRLGRDIVEAMNEPLARLSEPSRRPDEVVRLARAAVAGCRTLGVLAEAARGVLAEQGFVQMRGLPVTSAASHAVAWACLLGDPYIDPGVGGAVITAHVRPGQALMGNQLRRLPLHTDYSMLQSPPRLTISFCVRPDPTPGMGCIDVVDIESMLFGLEPAEAFERFRTVPLPFASQSSADATDFLETPILTQLPDRPLLVRYHRSRIAQGFRQRGVAPDARQCATMLEFEELTGRYAQTLHPEAGDLTVIDNHRCLHGRGRCSVEVDAEGNTVGRQMLFVFAT